MQNFPVRTVYMLFILARYTSRYVYIHTRTHVDRGTMGGRCRDVNKSYTMDNVLSSSPPQTYIIRVPYTQQQQQR